jgi:NAD(P)-dependent dehydrogenase (short-subunit alcohol dehydrogenase family)
MSTNVRGVFLGTRACAPVMAGQGQGSISTLSSMDGHVGSPGHIAYGGSKGAVRTRTKDVAIEDARRGVRVHSVHPGSIHTHTAEYGARVCGGMLEELGEGCPVGPIGEPIDVAYGVLSLASDASTCVTGSEFISDGGATAAG